MRIKEENMNTYIVNGVRLTKEDLRNPWKMEEFVKSGILQRVELKGKCLQSVIDNQQSKKIKEVQSQAVHIKSKVPMGTQIPVPVVWPTNRHMGTMDKGPGKDIV